MIDGSSGTLGMPAYEISTFAAGEDGAFLLSLYDSAGRCQLTQYKYDASVPTRASRELTVHGLIIRYMHEQAAIQFQKKNPEVHVRVILIRMFTKSKSGKAYSQNDTSKL